MTATSPTAPSPPPNGSPANGSAGNGSASAPVAGSAVPYDPFLRRGKWWVLSIIVTLILVTLLSLLWVTWPDPREPDPELVNDRFYDVAATDINDGWPGAPAVPTGIFIQTLEFETATDVNVTGYAWQRFEGDYEASFKEGIDSRSGLIPLVDLRGVAGEPGRTCPENLPEVYLERLERLEHCVRPGIVFPDMVDSGFDLRPFVVGYEPTGADVPGRAEPAADSTQPPPRDFEELDPKEVVSAYAPGTTTIVWYFEGPIRQEVDYSHYPFDDKVIRFRIWPADFESSAYLRPDYRGYPCSAEGPARAEAGTQGSGKAYTCTGIEETFGVDERIVLSEFQRPKDSYFDVEKFRYSSDFGLDRFDQDKYPDLSYNLVLRRSLLNAMVGNLVPFVVAAGLCFAVLLTITGNATRSALFHFSTTQVITTLSVLFFAVLLAHLQLRGRFEGVVYFEVFYFALYLMLFGVAIDAVLVTAPQTRNLKLFRYGDNLIVQLLYLPSLFSLILVVTMFVRPRSWSLLWSWWPWS